MTWVASNLVHGRIGRMWMSVRDMDLAAELIGIRLLRAKLLAFAVSSFYCGVAGAMMVFLWYGGAEAEVFAIDQSFLVLFMVIIGGLGTLIGSFFGAALIYILPIALRAVPAAFGLPIHPAAAEQLTFVIVGALDYRLSGARAERARPAVANWQAEIEGVALSLLVSACSLSNIKHIDKRCDIGRVPKAPLIQQMYFARVSHRGVPDERLRPHPHVYDTQTVQASNRFPDCCSGSAWRDVAKAFQNITGNERQCRRHQPAAARLRPAIDANFWFRPNSLYLLD